MKTTNTTTNTVPTYDLARVMRRAWSIRRAAAAEFDCKVTAVHWGECLRAAWAEEYVHAAPVLAERLTAEWAATEPAAQVRWLTACVRKAAKVEIGRSIEDQYNGALEVPAFYMPWDGPSFLAAYDMSDFVNSAWEKLARVLADPEKLAARIRARAEAGRKPFDLGKLVYSAGRAAVVQVIRTEQKHSVTGVRTVTDDNGTERAYVEVAARSVGFGSMDMTALAADIGLFLQGRDDTDRRLLAMLVRGETEAHMASVVGMSTGGTHKRLANLRSALAEYLGMSWAPSGRGKKAAAV